MKKWAFIKTFSGAIMYEHYTPENFYLTDDKKHVYFHHKYYNIIDSHKTDNMTIYNAICIRHTGKKHVKYEVTFAVHRHGVGYCESFFKEVK